MPTREFLECVRHPTQQAQPSPHPRTCKISTPAWKSPSARSSKGHSFTRWQLAYQPIACWHLSLKLILKYKNFPRLSVDICLICIFKSLWMAGQLQFVIETTYRRLFQSWTWKIPMFTRVDNQLITCCRYASRSWDLHHHWQQWAPREATVSSIWAMGPFMQRTKRRASRNCFKRPWPTTVISPKRRPCRVEWRVTPALPITQSGGSTWRHHPWSKNGAWWPSWMSSMGSNMLIACHDRPRILWLALAKPSLNIRSPWPTICTAWSLGILLEPEVEYPECRYPIQYVLSYVVLRFFFQSST